MVSFTLAGDTILTDKTQRWEERNYLNFSLQIESAMVRTRVGPISREHTLPVPQLTIHSLKLYFSTLTSEPYLVSLRFLKTMVKRKYNLCF